MEKRKINDTLPDQLMSKLSGFGSDISAARRARNISQASLAERINVARRTIVRMEQGDPRVSFSAYASVAWVFGLEDKLFSAFSSETDPVQVREARLNIPRRIDAPRGAKESAEKVSANDTGLDF
jgi:DNA-binding XRE family transcriptional regulator